MQIHDCILIRPVAHSNAGAVVCIFNEKQKQHGLRHRKFHSSVNKNPTGVYSLCLLLLLWLLRTSQINDVWKADCKMVFCKTPTARRRTWPKCQSCCQTLDQPGTNKLDSATCLLPQRSKKKRNQFFLQAFFSEWPRARTPRRVLPWYTKVNI